MTSKRRRRADSALEPDEIRISKQDGFFLPTVKEMSLCVKRVTGTFMPFGFLPAGGSWPLTGGS
jgi:hypothetical protein